MMCQTLLGDTVVNTTETASALTELALLPSKEDRVKCDKECDRERA